MVDRLCSYGTVIKSNSLLSIMPKVVSRSAVSTSAEGKIRYISLTNGVNAL